jgi:hypothetical protein
LRVRPHLVDDVLPRVPVRHWVLSFPHRVRYLLPYDPRLFAAVRRIFVRVVLGWHQERARREGVPGARSGAVVFTQRFGSALNSNLHFHALVTDGVFTCPSSFTRAFFHPAESLRDEGEGEGGREHRGISFEGRRIAATGRAGLTCAAVRRARARP